MLLKDRVGTYKFWVGAAAPILGAANVVIRQVVIEHQRDDGDGWTLGRALWYADDGEIRTVDSNQGLANRADWLAMIRPIEYVINLDRDDGRIDVVGSDGMHVFQGRTANTGCLLVTPSAPEPTYKREFDSWGAMLCTVETEILSTGVSVA